MSFTRHFIHVGGRRVHYRRWGEGPAILAVHGSPQSSRAVAMQAEAFAARGFCVIAPDTPGNGLSTPLAGDTPATADYAQALIAFADTLGLGRVGLYGFHTGAATACAFAALQPQRTTAIAFDGLPCWTDDERADLLANYLTPFAPAWDGSHMAWLWARLEEQTVFFPWHDSRPAMRMDYDVSPLAGLHANALDLLDAGDHYRAPYASAFTFRPEDWLAQVSAPMLLATTGGDPLRVHLRRDPLAGLSSQVFDTPQALIAAAADNLAAHPGDPAPAAPADGGSDEGLAYGFAGPDGAKLHWCGRLRGEGRPLVLLHDAGGSAALYAPMLAAVAARRPVIALDLPGHGASGDDWPQAPERVELIAEAVGAALRGLGLENPAVAGLHLGGQVAAHLYERRLASSAATLGVSIHDEAEAAELKARACPSLAAEWDGAHLVRAFRIARWEQLFHPWFRRDRAHAIPQRSLAPADVHARAVALLKAGERWAAAVRAETAFNLAPARGLDGLTVFAVEGDPLSRPERLARLGRPAVSLPSSPAGWASTLSQFAL